MPGLVDYRVFFLDHAGHFVGTGVITCAGDADALSGASEHLGRYPALEVWQLKRPVGRITAAAVGAVPALLPACPEGK